MMSIFTRFTFAASILGSCFLKAERNFPLKKTLYHKLFCAVLYIWSCSMNLASVEHVHVSWVVLTMKKNFFLNHPPTCMCPSMTDSISLAKIKITDWDNNSGDGLERNWLAIITTGPMNLALFVARWTKRKKYFYFRFENDCLNIFCLV